MPRRLSQAVLWGSPFVAMGVFMALHELALSNSEWLNFRSVEETCRQSGQYEDCSKACDAGIGDEGGCLAAAEAAPSPNGDPSSGWDTARSLLQRGCGVGAVRTCLALANRIESRLKSSRTTTWDELRAPLESACSLDDREGCRRLAVWWMRQNPTKAREVRAKFCGLSEEPEKRAACEAPWHRGAALVARLKPKCDSGDVAACEELGNELLPLSASVSHDAFARACELRGLLNAPPDCGDEQDPGLRLDPLPVLGNLGFCVSRRLNQALHRWHPEERNSNFYEAIPEPPPETSGARGVVRVAAYDLQSGAARPGFEKALAAQMDSVSRCYDAARQGRRWSADLDLSVLIDRLGDVESAAQAGWNVVSPDTPVTRELPRCVSGTLRRARFPEGPDALRVRVQFDFKPP